MNYPEIICHLERNLPFTAFESHWIPSSARFVSVGCDSLNNGFIGVYELSGGAIQAVQEVKKPTALRCSTFGAASLKERHLATGDFGGTLQEWDLEHLESPVTSYKAHQGLINCIDGTGLRDGGSRCIATGSSDGFVKIWDPRQPKKATLSIGPEEGENRQDCWSVAFGTSEASTDERVVAAGYDNGDLKLFDLREMKLLWEKNVKHGICSLDFSGDSFGSKLVATAVNAKVHVCDTAHPDNIRGESAHKSTVWCASHLRQNPDIFMTAGGNGNLNLWRHESADKSNKIQLLGTSSISNEPVCQFSWHPDKTGLGLTTSFDQIARIIIVTRLTESKA